MSMTKGEREHVPEDLSSIYDQSNKLGMLENNLKINVKKVPKMKNVEKESQNDSETKTIVTAVGH